MKTAMTFVAVAVLIGLFAHSTSLAQEAFRGDWTGEFENKRCRLSLKTSRGGSILDSWASFEAESIKGLTVPDSSDITPIHFEVAREAGTIVFDGMTKNGHGIGDYLFTPNRDYLSAMKSMGYDNLSNEQLLRLALRDVTRAFVTEMRAAGYNTATVDQLIRMRNHNITASFVREIKAAGYDGLSVDQLVRMRNHKIDVAFIRSFSAVGYASLTVDQLIRLRNHEVTPESIGELKALGYDNLSPDTLIRLRNHDVTPGFIKQLSGSGHRDLSPEDLIYIRNHGLDAYTNRRIKRAR
ncbi:MAG TPA: hypothetical protein VLM38_03395 [Blastocatellia bacterium]|nr:hypothetical protein [Blastocatellia bacterium]